MYSYSYNEGYGMVTKTIKLTLALVAASALIGSTAYAVSQSVSATVKFATPITLTKNSDINFGTVGTGAQTFKINTTGTVTAIGAGTAQPLGGATTASNITIKGSPTQTINVNVNGYGSQSGVTLQNANCRYDTGTEALCSAASFDSLTPNPAGKILYLGVEAVADGSQIDNQQVTTTFNVDVIYN